MTTAFQDDLLAFQADAFQIDAVVAAVVTDAGGGGAARRKKQKRKQRPPAPEPRFIPWLDPYTPWSERDQEPTEQPTSPAAAVPGLDALVGSPGQNLRLESPPVAVRPTPRPVADTVAQGPSQWEAIEIARLESERLDHQRLAEDDEEAVIMLLLT